MGGCKSFFFFKGKRTRDFAFVSLCYGRSGEEMCMGYAMAASGRMQYDYKQTPKHVLKMLSSTLPNMLNCTLPSSFDCML